MAKKFENYMIIHCPERQQAEWLIEETDIPERNSKIEAISGWDKYKEKTVYGLMWKPSYERPTLVWFGAIDDEGLAGMKITEYTNIEEM